MREGVGSPFPLRLCFEAQAPEIINFAYWSRLPGLSMKTKKPTVNHTLQGYQATINAMIPQFVHRCFARKLLGNRDSGLTPVLKTPIT